MLTGLKNNSGASGTEKKRLVIPLKSRDGQITIY